MTEAGSSGRVASSRESRLGWEVHVAPSLPVVTSDFAPGEHERPWPPIPSTLVYGKRDAVVVDSFITAAQTRAQASWISSKRKRLTAIYATHGHGDHFLGAGLLRSAFPGTRFVAHRDAIPVMRRQVSPDFLRSFWESRFPGQLPSPLETAESLDDEALELEGERLEVVPLGFTDVEGTSCLHIPSLGLVAAGDAVYNGVHPRLVEAIQQGKLEDWLRALDRISSLDPNFVVAGHKDPRLEDTPIAVGETQQYIVALQGLAKKATSKIDLYETMLRRDPGRLNRGALWSSVGALLP